jgi:hypothetical protein
VSTAIESTVGYIDADKKKVSTPMLDVHAPHQSIPACLLIAIGLEQTVEYLHHRHQQEQIEQQMHGVFSDNVSSDADDLKRLASMAPYESEKENGTVALLPVERIRIYNRLYFQRQLLVTLLQNWQAATLALAEFT